MSKRTGVTTCVSDGIVLFKPMLAATVNKDDVLENKKWPLIASPKYDGIRCIIRDGMAVTRTMKAIPNDSIRLVLEHWMRRVRSEPGFENINVDGEIISGDNFSETTGNVMRKSGTPSFVYYIFDAGYFDMNDKHFAERLNTAGAVVMTCPEPFIRLAPQSTVKDEGEVAKFYAECLSAGFEGIILRDPASMYKHGRSTVREFGMVKMKDAPDAEAVVIGYEQLFTNTNPAMKDAFGRTERSTAMDGLVAMPMLGSLRVRRPDGVEFNIGSGFTQSVRKRLWATRADLSGQLVKYKYQESGSKDAPRFPVFIGFRSKEDV